jgi:hypothetical protein
MDNDTAGRRWTAADYSEILAGMADPALLRKIDARGLTPGLAATLESGEKVNLLMTLLDMAADHEGVSSLDRIENLLAEMVEQQKTTNERLNALILLFSSRANREAAWENAKALADETVPPLRARGRRKSEPERSGD